MIGEMALLAGGTRSATVKAITHCRILTVSFGFFHAALDQVSIPAYKILRRVIYSITTRLEELRGRILQQWDCGGYRRPSSAAVSGPASPAEIPSQTCSFEYRAFLPVIPFFAGFTDDQIDRFVAHARALELPRGEYLYREGARADSCFLVIRGAVEISVMRDRRYQLAVLGPGRLCGANSLITATARNSDARVRSAALLLRLDESAFRTLYQGESEECLHFQRMVSINQLQELKAADNLLSTLGEPGSCTWRGRETVARNLPRVAKKSALHVQVVNTGNHAIVFCDRYAARCIPELPATSTRPTLTVRKPP